MAAAQRKKKFYFWRPVIKTTRSRSLFKALDLICICKPITWSYIQCEEAKKHKMSAVITSSSFTCCEQKDTFASPSFVVIWNCGIVPVRNKLSFQATTAVGISYFRKPHLHVKQHEVVIWCELIVARLNESCAEWMVRQLLLHSL